MRIPVPRSLPLSLSLFRAYLLVRLDVFVIFVLGGKGALKGEIAMGTSGLQVVLARDELEQQDLLTSILKKGRILNRRGEKRGNRGDGLRCFFLWKIFRKKEFEYFKERGGKKRRCRFEKLDQGREGRLWKKGERIKLRLNGKDKFKRGIFRIFYISFDLFCLVSEERSSSIPLLKEGSTWHYWVVTRETNSLFSKYFRFLPPPFFFFFFLVCVYGQIALWLVLCSRCFAWGFFFFFLFLDGVVFGIEFAIGLRSFEW